MTPATRLRRLLLELFTAPRELRELVERALGAQVARGIYWERDLETVAYHVVQHVLCLGLERPLLEALADARAGRRDDIHAVAGELATSIEGFAAQAPGGFGVLILLFDRLASTGGELRIERVVHKHLVRFAERNRMPLWVSVLDQEAPLTLKAVQELGRARGADLVIWGDAYHSTGSLEIDLRWALLGPEPTPRNVARDGSTGARALASLSLLMDGHLLENVDFIVTLVTAMRQFENAEYAEAAELLQTALRIAPPGRGSVEMGINEKGIRITIDLPMSGTLLMLAVSLIRSGDPHRAIVAFDRVLEVQSTTTFADVLGVSLRNGDPEQVRILLAAACWRADAYEAAGLPERADERRRHLISLLRGSKLPRNIVVPAMLAAVRALATRRFGDREPRMLAALARLAVVNGRPLSSELATWIGELGEAELAELDSATSGWGLRETTVDAAPWAPLEHVAAHALASDVDEADVLRRIAVWLGTVAAADLRAHEALVAYFVTSAPAFLDYDELRAVAGAFTLVDGVGPAAGWVRVLAQPLSEQSLAEGFAAMIQHGQQIAFERVIPLDIAEMFLGFALRARADEKALRTLLHEAGVVPEALDAVPAWLRDQLDRIATPGTSLVADKVPALYLVHVLSAWSHATHAPA